jgi:2,3-bisphosphoglycerate-independent phosphoglycerate mutase
MEPSPVPDRRILMLFVDGIGLGAADPAINPFVTAHTPTLWELADGAAWTNETPFVQTAQATFVPTDAQLGVPGRPQSGSNQAVILTGRNIPKIIGRHYGPKPDQATRALIREGTVLSALRGGGKSAALVDAYPPDLLARIARGKTLPSSIQQAAIDSGQVLFGAPAVAAGDALTPEWTGDEWHTHLRLLDVPILSPQEAGLQLLHISRRYHFTLHSHWMTDYVGHRGTMDQAVRLLERFDGVLGGIIGGMGANDLVIVTSDHGNLEHMGDRHHTENLVPTVVIGQEHAQFALGIHDLSDIAPRILNHLFVSDPASAGTGT